MLREHSTSTILSHEETMELVKTYQETECQKAITKLVMHNRRLVLSNVRKYRNRGVEECDLESAGNHGLLVGTKRFDISLGNKFSTYITPWIKKFMLQEIYDSKMISIPSNKRTLITKFYAELDKNDNDYEKTIQMAEFAEYKSYLHEIMTKSDVTSLDTPVKNGDGETTVADVISADVRLVAVNVLSVESEVRRVLFERLHDVLTEQELTIMKYRCGVDTAPMTNNEIGKEIGYTGERVRQFTDKIYRKILKHAPARKELYSIFKEIV